VDLNYDRFKDPAPGILEAPSYIADGGGENGYKNFSSGLGFLVSYDTRDLPANAYRGVYFDAKGLWYNKLFGSDNNFYKVELEYRQYKLVGKRKVIAWTVQSEHRFGHIPINKYTLTGTPFDLRGYYMGQYRDRSSHVLLAEYRQMINTDGTTRFKRILNRVGFVAWAGSGFMGPTPMKIEGVLPNAGVGLRFEVQPRLNIRIDIGHNFRNNSTLFYMNMTEAF
ncbi:MAG: BamA/TamA family outer membrane protein, partial [Tannerellaceae bacterium]|nr:BamA/TamA family outer membrane protein [Tannerellaceae bacterium]